MLACFAATFCEVVQAQQINPVVDDRVDFGLVSNVETVPLAPLVEDDGKKSPGWELAASISAAYDSNIFLNATDEVSDQVYRIGTIIAYKQGDPLETEGAFIDVAYKPTAILFKERGTDNRIDHQALWLAGWRGKVTTFSYKGGLQKLGDATADTGEQANRTVLENEVRAAWAAREKLTFELAAGASQTAYESPSFFDSSNAFGEIVIRYAYSPKTQVGIAYQVSRFDVDGASPQNVQQLTGNISWQPREKIQISLQAGAENRKTDNGTQINPVFEGRIDWGPREGTKLYLTAYQKQQASAFLLGQNYKALGMTAGISQRVGRQWTALLEGGRETTTYTRVSGEGPSGREDQIWFVRPALEYKITDDIKVALFYRVSKNSSNNPLFGYDQNLAGIEFNYQF